MRFRDQQVWVRADDGGRLILDGDGRAEMKYRESDEKSYRPSPGNLAPVEEGARSAPAEKRGPGKRALARRPPAELQKIAGAMEVWTDGACSGNPGPMAIGVVVLDGEGRRELGEYLGIGTNNIAELTAIERGLEIADEITGGDRARPVRVYSDSGYAIGLLSQGWKAKANQELVARIRRRLADLPNVQFVKVAGHAGIPENERCDELARQAILTRGTVVG
jgi:ribonuclease HI